MPKPKITEELLLKVAENARIKLSKDEVKEFLPQLEEILKSFSRLDELHVEHEEPTYHPLGKTNALREDNPRKCLTQEEALSNTTLKKDGYFKGPRVI